MESSSAGMASSASPRVITVDVSGEDGGAPDASAIASLILSATAAHGVHDVPESVSRQLAD